MLLVLQGEGPLYRRLYLALREKILSGEFPAGALLPGSRTLATDLGVSRIVTLAAYEQLAAEGYVESIIGKGTRVAAQLSLPLRRSDRAARTDVRSPAPLSAYAKRAQRLAPQTAIASAQKRNEIDFNYTVTVPEPRTLALWRRAVARATARPQLRYPDPAGLRSLRGQLVTYLREQRGVIAEPDDVLIVSGAQQAIDLTARVLCDRGTVVAIEDPHYQGTRQAFLAAGAELVPCPVDIDGLDIKRGGARVKRARAVCVTPSHQFPTGAIMSVSRRLALLQWARRNGSWIIEDDYDSEFRYGVGAVPALQGLDDSGRVIYIGSFARMLFPSLRLGYIVAPPSLRETFRAVKWLADRGSPTLEQQALATLLESGAYESARRRAVRSLSVKRDKLVSAIEGAFGTKARASGAASGTHLFLTFPQLPAAATERLVDAARNEGVVVHSARQYYLRAPRFASLILGYTTVATDDIEEGVKRFARGYRKLIESHPSS
jgi:GntR family transcriptional regulator/MocR family aminotransferase